MRVTFNKQCEVCGGIGSWHTRYWFMRTRWFHTLRAVLFVCEIVRKPWSAKSDDPFDNISVGTAWEVARGIHLEGRTMTVDEAKQIVLAKYPKAVEGHFGIWNAEDGESLSKPHSRISSAWIDAAETVKQEQSTGSANTE